MKKIITLTVFLGINFFSFTMDLFTKKELDRIIEDSQYADFDDLYEEACKKAQTNIERFKIDEIKSTMDALEKENNIEKRAYLQSIL